MIRLGTGAVALFLAATPAIAQARAPAGAGCELHVWSSQKIKAYVSGWSVALGGGALGGLLDGKMPSDKAILVILKKAMEPPTQATLLEPLGLAQMLGLPAVTVIHEAPLATPDTWKTAKGRLSASTSACYGELIVRDLYFLKTALFKPEMRVNFTYRLFGDKADKPLVMEGRGGNNMTVYPLVSTQDLDQIITDFRYTYQMNFREFVNDQIEHGALKGGSMPPPPPAPATQTPPPATPAG